MQSRTLVLVLTFFSALAMTATPGVSAASTIKILHRFKGPDGANPMATLTFDSQGNLYGSTASGGIGDGTVFKITPTGQFTSYSNVGGGFVVQSSIVLDSSGNMYGTTVYGGGSHGCDWGSAGCGTIFKIDPSGNATVFFVFNPNKFPAYGPLSGLIRDSAGNFYGTATSGCIAFGMPQEWGEVYKADPTGKMTAIYSFTGGSDGGCPIGPLVQDAAGNLYGTTAGTILQFESSFPPAPSVVFELSPNTDNTWTYSVLHTFSGPDGIHPSGNLIFDKAGNLYGTTFDGGTSTNCPDGCGVVFQLKSNGNGSWTEKVIHTFGNLPAAHPYAGLAIDSAGNLYGTTVNGGPANGGVIFKLSPQADGTWKGTNLHTFIGKDAENPYGGLVLDGSGNIYGTADCVPNTSCQGIVFEISQ